VIDFLRYQRFGLFFFIALVGVFLGAYIYKQRTRGYAFVYSIDFTGGTQAQVRFSADVTSAEISETLTAAGFPYAIIREFSPREFVVRVRERGDDIANVAETVKSVLQKHFANNSVEIVQVDSVGAGVGASLWWQSLRAVLICLIAMSIYIFIRSYSVGFAMGAVGSLFHDAFLIITFCLVLDYEISINIIAAILTILGYSINDTIIIFSRIRENALVLRSMPLYDVVNVSINETLRRTLLTSFFTILVVVSLIVFGGTVLRSLSLALLIGLVFGTYSSICVASPVMLMFNKGK